MQASSDRMRSLLDCVVCDISRAMWQMLHLVDADCCCFDTSSLSHYTASYPEDTSPIPYRLKLEVSWCYGPLYTGINKYLLTFYKQLLPPS